MNVLLYHSSDGKAGRESFPVIITSFEVVMNDRRFLAKYKWKYIVVDEVR
jgi:ATP-dependent DNA helicase